MSTPPVRPGAVDIPPRSMRLEVYVARDCPTCVEARRLAIEAARRYPAVDVRVLDLEETPLPEQIVAVPTYLLNGAVISLGNPYPEDLFAELEAVA